MDRIAISGKSCEIEVHMVNNT